MEGEGKIRSFVFENINHDFTFQDGVKLCGTYPTMELAIHAFLEKHFDIDIEYFQNRIVGITFTEK